MINSEFERFGRSGTGKRALTPLAVTIFLRLYHLVGSQKSNWQTVSEVHTNGMHSCITNIRSV